MEHEQTGKLYEAIQFYKRAVQLVPDIEFRLYESTKQKTRERIDTEDGIESRDENQGKEIDEEDEEDGDGDLLTKITRIVCRNRCVCSPQFEQSVGLPMIILFFLGGGFPFFLWIEVTVVNCFSDNSYFGSSYGDNTLHSEMGSFFRTGFTLFGNVLKSLPWIFRFRKRW